MTTVITYIYRPNFQTEIMEASCKRFFPLVNCFNGKQYTGNPALMRALVDTMKEMTDVDLCIYSDGGDTIFLDKFEPNPHILIYSAEKACWPLPQLAILYPDCPTPWKYLNGGNWCGPRELAIEFQERYVLPYCWQPTNDGQSQQSAGLLKALQDGFPIRLDYRCNYFQSMAFEANEDFEYTETRVINKLTGSIPAVLHYNGRTEPSRGIELYKNQLR